MFPGCRANKGTRKQEREEKTNSEKTRSKKRRATGFPPCCPNIFCLPGCWWMGWNIQGHWCEVFFFPCILAGCVHPHNSLLWYTPYLQQRHIGETYRNKNRTLKMNGDLFQKAVQYVCLVASEQRAVLKGMSVKCIFVIS